MKRSYIGMIVFGLLVAYSVFVLVSGGNPGGTLIIGIVGFVVSLGDYLASQNKS